MGSGDLKRTKQGWWAQRSRLATATQASLGALAVAIFWLFASMAANQTFATAQRPGGFRILGPGGGGTLLDPAISPHDPQTMLASSDMSGGYITHNGGQSWRMFNLRGQPRQFVFDPVDARVIYAVGIGLWESTDEGDTWALIAPSPSSVRGVSVPTDEAEVTILSKDVTSSEDEIYSAPTALAIDPQNHEHLFATRGLRLWASRDGGVHWSPEDRLPAAVSQIAIVRKSISDAKPNILMAGSEGIWLSRGAYAQSLVMLKDPVVFSDISMDVIGDKVLLLAVVGEGHLMQSWIDLAAKKPGTPWKDLPLPGTGGQVAVAASAHDGRTIYASYSGLQLDGKVWEGIAKSEDLGAHWTLVLKDSGKNTQNFKGNWIETELGEDWGDKPLGMTVSTKNPAVVLATNEGGALKSVDGGVHWSELNSRTGADGGAVTNGVDVLTSYGTFFDPFDTQRMFVGYVDIGLMRSDNRGKSWRTASAGVPRAWVNSTYWMVFDPAVRGRVWAAKSGTHDLPRPRMWRKNDVSSFAGGVCVSQDGGKRWSVAGSLPSGAVTHLLLDPRSPVKSRVLYAAVFGHGVYKSTDGGRSWSQKNKGIAQPNPLIWRVAMARAGTLYAVIVRESVNAAPGDPRSGALYRSRDGAETWESVALPSGVNGPTDLAIDPRQPARLYLSAWAYNDGLRGAGGGLFTSEDGGKSWKPSLERDEHVSSVTINPANPDELYAVGFESSAWHSSDRGAHWKRIAGYNFKAGLRVTPDPAHVGMVYINTFGGGVWYGAVDGPAVVEDISTRQIAP